MTRATDKHNPSTRQVFHNRREAGRILAQLLHAYSDRDDVVVLGLARGGIPVAWEVATALRAPLDAFVVRKLGVPGHEEFAVGALASGGRVVINDDIVRAVRISPQQLRDVAERESRELLRRESAYRDGRPPAKVTGKTVILVDDGLATGASMLAAVQALRDDEPAEIVVAVPAAPESTCRELAGLVDDLVCATMPTPFFAVGESYWEFDQVTDQEVRDLLAAPTQGGTPPGRLGIASPAEVVRRIAVEAPGGVPDSDMLAQIVGTSRIVLIGESSHGTHEFYQARAEITKWLIEEKGFNAVAAEADWPDAYRVNRFVHGAGTDCTAEESLRGFERFPAWMWRNVVVRDFVDWLRLHNQGHEKGCGQAGFYGLDLYSMHRSMREVIAYLDTVDPLAAARARRRYSCFDHASADDGQTYGYAAAFGAGLSCENEAVEQLIDMQHNAFRLVQCDGALAEDELFYATQNALTVRNAEVYYRAMFSGRVSSWNLRDTHMAQTLAALRSHLQRHPGSEPAKIVVWAHNSHVGDARATEVAADGQVTLGQLVRERFDDCCLIGFSTYNGTVTAASEWGGSAELKTVRPALNGSVEELFHEVDVPAFCVWMHDANAADVLDTPRLGRAVGVIYRPSTERQSHYFHVRPAEQFDAMIHIDTTTALKPLEPSSLWIVGETPETYPSGL